MYRELIEKTRDRILAEVTEFNEVLPWNNQIDSMELSQERSYNFPNCFIGFQIPALFTNEASGQQHSTIELTLYIVDEIYSNEFDDGTPNLDIFDIKQKTFIAMQGYTDGFIGPFSRIAEETDEDHPNLYVFKQTYTVELIDCTIPDNKEKATPTGAIINGEIVIDDIVIRTSKEKFNG